MVNRSYPAAMVTLAAGAALGIPAAIKIKVKARARKNRGRISRLLCVETGEHPVPEITIVGRPRTTRLEVCSFVQNKLFGYESDDPCANPQCTWRGSLRRIGPELYLRTFL